MVNIRQVVFSIFTFRFADMSSMPEKHAAVPPSKSIAVVGAGSAGLAMLKTLLELPEDTRKGWDIVLYEQRQDVGGIWLPDPNSPPPPELPKTPLYPLLTTNTPVPTMTYPGFPFPPNTPLYPRHQHVEAYHRAYAAHFGLLTHIRFNHTVLRATWIGNETAGQWDIVVHDADTGATSQRTFDHLVVAGGNNHYPHVPVFKGQERWLAQSPGREIRHSIWYKGPERYANRSVVVVGSGASGRDAALQVATTARRVYQSRRDDYEPPADLGIILKPEISHFADDAIVFADGTSTSDADAVILGTGYDLRVPFLEHGSAVTVEPRANVSRGGLVTNLRYIFPLHQHIVSLCSSHPPHALTFVGLPALVANCPSDRAQSLFAAHVIANASLLPPRAELLGELAAKEDALRARGWDPYWVGHRLVDGKSFDYQDEVVGWLKEQGAIKNDGKPFVEDWRRDAGGYEYLKRAWARVEQLETQDEWLKGVESEEEWSNMMHRLNKWQKDWEDREGTVYPVEWKDSSMQTHWTQSNGNLTYL